MLKSVSFALSRDDKQNGSTLIELMIAMVVSVIIMFGMIGVTVGSLKSSRENLQIIKLDQELRAVMDIMINDIQRAGYWRDAYTDANENRNLNPFMASGTDLAVSTPTPDCILFTYDRDNDGALPAVNTGTDDERYGFRLSGGAVQTRTISSPFSCTALPNTWEDLTDKNVINISALQFTSANQVITVSGASTLTIRKVTISITGNLVGDTTVMRTLTESVRVKNDKFTP